MNRKIINQIKKAPQSPGVYIFKNKKGRFLYIGKAVNLKNRIKQYFGKKTYSPFLEHILNEAAKVEFKKTDSEIEALILESRLIKEHQPKYNIMLRDDKQYFYVVFTNEKFPKIFLTHQPRARGPAPPHPHRAQSADLRSAGGPPVGSPLRLATHYYIGPFTDGTALKAALRLLRRIFPYCTCKQKHNNFCLNYHIGKCPGICCLKNHETKSMKHETQRYKKNIKAIKEILSGKKDSLIKKLKKELNQLAENQNFENAIKLRNQVEKLEKIFANAKIISDSETETRTKSILKSLVKAFKLPHLPKRIEGYDISNIQGKNAVGAMVVFSDGKPDKNGYRKFKIRLKKTSDDTAMLKEIIIRRFNHREWPYPDLIFIDGGKGQLNAAQNAIAFIAAYSGNWKFRLLTIISLAKGKNEVFATTLKKPLSLKKLPNGVKNLILNIDAEAHRFAISFYRKIHRKSLLK
ncbi:MAG: GIY-YIG nuclease family protein [Parcubacteria group bacterium]|nr:GIY-YIG nuclease family protein [Parcubacteria group bacterium]